MEGRASVEGSFREGRWRRKRGLLFPHAAGDVINSPIMPLPIIPLVVGALLGKASSKPEKKTAVNGRVKKDGTRAKAHMRKAAKKK